MNKRNLMIIAAALIVIVVFAFICFDGELSFNRAPTSDVKVLEIVNTDGIVLAEDLRPQGPNNFKAKYYINTKNHGIVAEVGDVLRVTYSGWIQESHPAKFYDITKIEVIKK